MQRVEETVESLRASLDRTAEALRGREVGAVLTLAQEQAALAQELARREARLVALLQGQGHPAPGGAAGVAESGAGAPPPGLEGALARLRASLEALREQARTIRRLLLLELALVRFELSVLTGGSEPLTYQAGAAPGETGVSPLLRAGLEREA